MIQKTNADDVAKWKKHIAEYKLNWINVSERLKFDRSRIAKQFDVSSIPLYMVVDKKGMITYNADEANDHDYVQLEAFIKKVL